MRTVLLLMAVGCANPGPPKDQDTSTPRTSTPSTTSTTTTSTTPTTSTTTTPTTPTTGGATTATGCLVPNPVYIDCVVEVSDDLFGGYQLSSRITYDACGRPVEFETYFFGMLASVDTWSYFADGRFDRIDTDFAPTDGIADQTAEFFYDAQSRNTRVDYDFGAYYGLCSLEQVYLDADEQFDETTWVCGYNPYSEVYTSDPALPLQHRWTTRTRDYGSDGTIEATETRNYDAVLDRSTVVLDDDQPGYDNHWTQVIQWTPSGLEDWVEQDDGHDGTVDSVTDYHYDAQGRLLGYDVTSYGPGLNYNVLYDWDCPGTTTP